MEQKGTLKYRKLQRTQRQSYPEFIKYRAR